jgi:transcriptional regulator with XRE-family HTH domain
VTGTTVRKSRESRSMTQEALASRLGVSQGYVSQLENGGRRVPPGLQKKLAAVLDMGPTALPLPNVVESLSGEAVAGALGQLGYRPFAHHRAAVAMNPTQLVLGALLSRDLDSRLAEGLAWLLARYPDLEWTWLLPRVKQHDLQNRLGFLLELAGSIAGTNPESAGTDVLHRYRTLLEKSRLDRDEPLSSLGMTQAEQRWLLARRSPEAQRWRVLSSLRPATVAHAGD